MTYRRWLTVALCMLVTGAILICAANYLLDPFGVFRDTRGRSLSVYENERTAKYLLNQRYVPRNFDGVLVGSSNSANWHTSMIQGARIYNESLDGGNATEERTLVEQALRTAHFKYALIVISPFITRDHVFHEAGMGKPKRREALGSINILREEWNEFLVRTHRQPREFYADGSKELHAPEINLARAGFPMDVFKIDPQALDDYRKLVAELRERNITIVFIQPPLYEAMYRRVRPDLARYLEKAHLVDQHDWMIDFNSPAYTGFRSNPANFDDGIHLSDQAAVQLSLQLNRDMQKIERATAEKDTTAAKAQAAWPPASPRQGLSRALGRSVAYRSGPDLFRVPRPDL